MKILSVRIRNQKKALILTTANDLEIFCHLLHIEPPACIKKYYVGEPNYKEEEGEEHSFVGDLFDYLEEKDKAWGAAENKKLIDIKNIHIDDLISYEKTVLNFAPELVLEYLDGFKLTKYIYLPATENYELITELAGFARTHGSTACGFSILKIKAALEFEVDLSILNPELLSNNDDENVNIVPLEQYEKEIIHILSAYESMLI